MLLLEFESVRKLIYENETEIKFLNCKESDGDFEINWRTCSDSLNKDDFF